LLTVALLAAGELERAAITSHALTTLHPGPTAYLLRSRALIEEDPHEALGLALSATAALPGVWVTHAQTARCYLALHDAKGRGLEAARTAVSLAPDEPVAHVLLGASLLRRGDLDQAEASAREALKLAPYDGEALQLSEQIQATRAEVPVDGPPADAGHRQGRAFRLIAALRRGLGGLLSVECAAVVGSVALVLQNTSQDGRVWPLVAVFALALTGVGVVSAGLVRMIGMRTRFGGKTFRDATMGLGLSFSSGLMLGALGVAALSTSAQVRVDVMTVVTLGFAGSLLAAFALALRTRSLQAVPA
jgi:tetratricopeptide (TPR) repeat protein